MSSFLIVLDTVLLVILLVFGGVWAWNKIQAKSLGGELTNEEFKEGSMKIAEKIEKWFMMKYIAFLKKMEQKN